MNIHFYKYEGAGNDFVMIDNRNMDFPKKEETIRLLCDRRFGIGADGLILLEDSTETDFKMVYYNSDGRESTFCGNGGRCVASFARKLDLVQDQTQFEAKDGLHEASFHGDTVRLKMRDVKEVKRVLDGYELFTGSPHFVVFTDHVSQTDVPKEGRRIRTLDQYMPDGINVNFVEKQTDGIYVRTYERGVEDETLSCGTGVTASALVAAFDGYNSPVHVETPGGKLEVEFVRQSGFTYTDVFLKGPARFVFEGGFEI